MKAGMRFKSRHTLRKHVWLYGRRHCIYGNSLCAMEAEMFYGSRGVFRGSRLAAAVGASMVLRKQACLCGSSVVDVEASTLYGIAGLCVPPYRILSRDDH